MRRTWGLLVLLPLVTALGGCRLLGVLFEDVEHVKAEYPHLANKRAVIIVRADIQTLSMYPHVQLELADHFRLDLEGGVKGLLVVDPRKVVDFQRSEPDWEKMDPSELGRRFGAERVIEVDLTQYTTREPGHEYLYRGHIAAAVRVYNAEYPNTEPTYKTHIEALYPEHGPSQWSGDERSIRSLTMQLFAQEAAGKFYDHDVKRS
jgi:hypothetical protein